MRHMLFQLTTVLALGSAALAQPRVIITEIMYNPASEENKNQTEWVEIANAGTEPIEIKDWRLEDEDKKGWGKFSCTLTPGSVAVLINADAITEEQFRAAWDRPGDAAAGQQGGYQVIGVKWSNLGNSPKADDEVLQLLNDKDEVICEIKQEGDWPSCRNPDGSSIWLSDFKAENSSDGKLWRRSESGKDGARQAVKTDLFSDEDIGSPGYVPGLSPTRPDVPATPPTPRNPKPPAQSPLRSPPKQRLRMTRSIIDGHAGRHKRSPGGSQLNIWRLAAKRRLNIRS